MLDDPKEKKELMDKLILAAGKKKKNSRFAEFRLFFNTENFFQLVGISLQIVLGLGVVSIAILGLIQPMWLSTFFSIIGSATAMVGVYLCFQFFSRNSVFDSLINKAIRRVIQSQN
jgi:hypothetical protein